MRSSRSIMAAVAAVAGLVPAAYPGAGGSGGDPWAFRSPRAQAAKKAYDQAARRASERYAAELSRLVKPLTRTLDRALDSARREGDQAEAAKLQRALKAASGGGLLPPSTETVGWSARFWGHSYLAVLAPVRWNQARAICKKLGGHLVCIEARDEMVFLQKLTSGVSVYVGATDAHREGDWRWVNGRPVPRELWKIKEPDGHRGQNHAALCPAGLYDVSDEGVSTKGFICEWDR